MLCWTSAPPTTWMPSAALRIGQVVGARKQTWGFAPWNVDPAYAGIRSAFFSKLSSGERARRGMKVALVDTLKLLCCSFDTGMRMQPAFLLRDHGGAISGHCNNGSRQFFRLPAGHDLIHLGEYLANIRVLGADDRHAERHALEDDVRKTFPGGRHELHVALLEDG